MRTPRPQTNLLERRLFYIPSFKIYGAVAGFYDYGPPGCAIKQNLTQAWRQHFVLEENMLEVGGGRRQQGAGARGGGPRSGGGRGQGLWSGARAAQGQQ
jgi:hypothetical protein